MDGFGAAANPLLFRADRFDAIATASLEKTGPT
jgi:tRNA U34 5-methylaminomethyl-2-thiouridine-forming methyltransferase MnmC